MGGGFHPRLASVLCVHAWVVGMVVFGHVGLGEGQGTLVWVDAVAVAWWSVLHEVRALCDGDEWCCGAWEDVPASLSTMLSTQM